MKWLIFIWLLFYGLFFGSGCANPNAKIVKWQYLPKEAVIRYNGNPRSEVKSRIMALEEAQNFCSPFKFVVKGEQAKETSQVTAIAGNRSAVAIPITFHDRFMFMGIACTKDDGSAVEEPIPGLL